MFLYRRKTSRGLCKYWSVKFTGTDGHQMLRSTKQQDKDKAREVALSWDKAARLALGGALTHAASQALFNEILNATTGETFNVPTVEAYFSSWLEAKRSTGKASGTLKRYKGVLARFVASLPERRRTSFLSSITALEIEHFRNGEAKSGKTAVTVNFALRVLHAVLNDARRKGVVMTNVAEAVETLPEEADQRIPFTDEQVRSLLSVASLEWRGMILFGYHAGVRLTDCANLTWSNVDLLRRTVTFRPKKTANRRRGADKDATVALHPDIIFYLESLSVSDNPEQPLFPALRGKLSGSSSGLSNIFSRLMGKANISVPLGQKKEGKGHRFRALGFHSLRHSFVSRLANSEVSADVRKQIVGHSSDEIHRRYTHLHLSLQQKAIAQLPSVL
jgi:integrase